MRSRRQTLLALALSALGGCTCPREAPAPAARSEGALSEAMKALTEREARLTSYHVVADSSEGGAVGHHEFFYRAPDRVRGVVTAPMPMTLAFDGRRLYRLAPAEKKLAVYTLKLSPERGAMLLASNFTPFVPEGYRAPLVPREGTIAKRVKDPRGPDAWEISTTVSEGGDRVADITYLLRIPNADFLRKVVKTAAGVEVTEVEDELCDEKRRLCLPKRVVTRDGDRAVLHTLTLSSIELGVDLPGDTFAVEAPEGYATEAQELSDSRP